MDNEANESELSKYKPEDLLPWQRWTGFGHPPASWWAVNPETKEVYKVYRSYADYCDD
jgi:hypothetical protein